MLENQNNVLLGEQIVLVSLGPFLLMGTQELNEFPRAQVEVVWVSLFFQASPPVSRRRKGHAQRSPD